MGLMRVAYFDLGFSREQYGLQPTRYGGGAVAARYLKEDPEVDFHVFAPAEAFDNVGVGERADRCHWMGPAVCEALQRGFPLSNLYNVTYFGPFDLILHPHTCATINRGSWQTPMVHFCGFDSDAGHPGNDYVLLYDPSFKPRFGERAKYVRIGKPVPDTFMPRVKEDFVFVCSRHDDHMATAKTAQACLAAGIKGVFAGPIHHNYPLLDHIDGKTTVYLGEIDEATKMDLHSRAQLYSLNHAWPGMPFNQSVIEAQGVGTPIWANGDSVFTRRYLDHGVNGWDSRYVTLADAFNRSLKQEVAQQDCWRAAREYDVSVMCRTFKQAFTEIVAEWRAEHLSS
jgi:hypothetical protein